MSLSGVNFNSHAHVERDYQQRFQDFPLLISTHTLTWSVTLIGHERFKDVFAFQLTRSRGAWRISIPMTGNDSAFQLTRSRGAWPVTWKCTKKIQYISTHTLTWSVTFLVYSFPLLYLISTHTLTWSVTCGGRGSSVINSEFQLTRSRGAWLIQFSEFLGYKKFQLTRSRGAWHILYAMKNIVAKFQLTRSRGAWLSV